MSEPNDWYGIGNDLTLTAHEKLVLFILKCQHYGAGVCRSGLARLKTYSGLSLSSVRKALRGLERKRWVETVRRHGRSSSYRLVQKQLLLAGTRPSPATAPPSAGEVLDRRRLPPVDLKPKPYVRVVGEKPYKPTAPFNRYDTRAETQVGSGPELCPKAREVKP